MQLWTVPANWVKKPEALVKDELDAASDPGRLSLEKRGTDTYNLRKTEVLTTAQHGDDSFEELDLGGGRPSNLKPSDIDS